LDQLTQCALHSKDKGVTRDRKCKEEIIVSLTTHGRRLYDAYIAIESIMQGSVLPNRIILWLSEEYKDTIIFPVTLQNQIERGLEVKYCKDIRSYTKLIYALKEFPEASIVTIDDDVIYPYDLIENFVNVHNRIEGVICANHIHTIPNDFDTNPITYDNMDLFTQYGEICRQRYLLEGYLGVLYPPDSLNKEVFNEKVFLDICSTGDDIWFSAMAMLNNTGIVYADPHLRTEREVGNDDVQAEGLRIENHLEGRKNDIQIQRVWKKYGIISQ